MSWCNGYHGPTIGLAYTHDFVTFHQLENAFLPYNRNGVLFPRRIDGRYAMLSRPSDRGHTPFGDMYYSESPDLCFWGRHRFVMAPTGGWQSTKVGPGPTPIETSEGWLLFYHGVLTSCNGFVYSFGAALLDLDQPWKVIYRTEPYLLSPQTALRVRRRCAQRGFPLCGAVRWGHRPDRHLLRLRRHGDGVGLCDGGRGDRVHQGEFAHLMTLPQTHRPICQPFNLSTFHTRAVSSMNPSSPLQLIPEYRDYLWGGQRLRPGQLTAEAWVVYAEDFVAAGPLAGRTLAEVAAQDPIGLLGERTVAQTGTRFPLLIKILDCAQWLSLQVHPDDEAAERLGGTGLLRQDRGVACARRRAGRAAHRRHAS